jgi:hypothetical protein
MALVATLLMSGPGVTVVRAEGPLASSLPPAPVCSADGPAPESAQLDALSQRLQELRSRAAKGEPVVVLNTRGYGYGVAPGSDLDSIRRELIRVQREANSGP